MKLITFTPVALFLFASGAVSQSGGDRQTGDYNFDGHLDYRQQSEQPGNQCGWWDYFIYDPEIDDFRPVETNLCKEEFDSERKLVVTRVNGGKAGLIYAIRHFRWEGFQLVPTYAEKQDFDPARNLFLRVRVSNIDSPLGPTVLSEILAPDEVDEKPHLSRKTLDQQGSPQ